MREAMRQVMEAPERLAISQTDSTVTIAAPDGRVTRLATDGTNYVTCTFSDGTTTMGSFTTNTSGGAALVAGQTHAYQIVFTEE